MTRPYYQQKIASLIVAVAILTIPGGLGTAGQNRKARPLAAAARPRLVLLVVADQFRYDYLERFGDLFDQKGLRRLLTNGASWVDANYDHVPTYTAPGHSTMMTGAYPALTGIVGNEWVDRETGKRVTSVSDPQAKLLRGGTGEDAASPRRLMADTLGDEMRMATRDRSKVIGVSIKGRAAILPSGRHANAAYWLSLKTGMMVSSDYYFKELPPWVTKFDDAHPADKYFGAKWERLLPEAEYLKRAGPDSPSWEKVDPDKADTNAFPHIVTGGLSQPGDKFYEALDPTPFANDIVLNFAKEVITNEQLGQDDDPDVLTLSFSGNDYVGHRYGPYSQEVMDVTLRFDRQLGELFDFVDAKIGLKNTLVVFTADHGVAPIPEHAIAMGLTGGKLSGGDILNTVRAAIAERYQPPAGVDYIYKHNENGAMKDSFINGNLYFDYAALKRDQIDLDEIEKVACASALTIRGIARCYTRAQLEQGQVPGNDPIARRILHGFYPRRSGDLVMIAEPFYALASADTATHATPYAYDTHVPLVIMGSGIVPGRYLDASSPGDIAPTLAALLRIQPPSNSVGRILKEAISH
jgi:predicted AlkP superfamily pyrophosphatase or phosphodiesterase